MTRKLSRRGFVKSSLLASAALPLAVQAQTQPSAPSGAPARPAPEQLPMGRIGDQEFSRLMLGGNLIGGWAHARELAYVSTLMRRYNNASKIRETLEIAESNGITVMNSWVMDDNAQLFEHWKCGGKMKWIAQARMDEGGGFSQLQKAIDQGAVGVHLTADAAESLVARGKLDTVAESAQFIRSRKKIAGIASHDLQLLVECEKAKLDFDFYQKTFHSHEYYTAPAPGDKAPVGAHDNSWCSDPQAVVDFMAKVTKPWIAFKILAAGAIPPRAAFPYAFNSGADFILVGMFDWQIAENAKLARRVVDIVKGTDSKRSRRWFS